MSFIPEIKMDFVPSDEEEEAEAVQEIIEENVPDDINKEEEEEERGEGEEVEKEEEGE